MADKAAKTNKSRETAKHIAAFWAWYELERHFEKTKSELRVSNNSLAVWIKKYDWTNRADALDAKTLEKAQKTIIEKNGKRLAEMIENHYKYGANLINIGGGYLRDKGVESGAQAIQAVKIGVDIQRTAEGLATEKQEIEHGGVVTVRSIELIDNPAQVKTNAGG